MEIYIEDPAVYDYDPFASFEPTPQHPTTIENIPQVVAPSYYELQQKKENPVPYWLHGLMYLFLFIIIIILIALLGNCV